jgi:hypothetical protein
MSNKTPNEGGFAARLTDINLHNILQIESLSRSTGVFSVSSFLGSGFLHFKNGELVHAEAGDLVGEVAAFEILSWKSGRIETSDKRIHSVRTVELPLGLILMRSAQAETMVAQEYLDPVAESEVEVVVDGRGNILENSDSTEHFAVRVALVDLFGTLIGQYVESGTPQSIEICGNDSYINISKSKDGLITGKFRPIPKLE